MGLYGIEYRYMEKGILKRRDIVCFEDMSERKNIIDLLWIKVNGALKNPARERNLATKFYKNGSVLNREIITLHLQNLIERSSLPKRGRED